MLELVDIKTLSEMIKIKPSTLYSWVEKGLIPHYKIHGLVRFRIKEVEEWLQKFHRRPEEKRKVSVNKKGSPDIERIIVKARREVLGH